MDGGLYSCDHCQARFPDLLSFEVHMLEHDDEIFRNIGDEVVTECEKTQMWVCDQCMKTFCEKSSYEAHVANHCSTLSNSSEHQDEEMVDTVYPTNATMGQHVCESCEHKYSSFFTLKQKLSDLKMDLYQCIICKLIFSAKNSSLVLHSDPKSKGMFLDSFRTSLDSVSSYMEARENNLIDMCHTVKQWQQNICQLLEKQCKICEICRKTVAPSALSKMEQRPFKCSGCKETFAICCSLRNHMAKHLGQMKVFSCRTCRKKFRVKANLLKHKMSHFTKV